ncbi:MAG: hypothetical protein ACYC7E_17495 [Armatimonadota bacterium]
MKNRGQQPIFKIKNRLLSPIYPPLLGRLADTRGIPATFGVVAALIVLALIVVSTLPMPRTTPTAVEASAR